MKDRFFKFNCAFVLNMLQIIIVSLTKIVSLYDATSYV